MAKAIELSLVGGPDVGEDMIRSVALFVVLSLVAGCGISVVQSPVAVSGGAKKRVLAFAGKEAGAASGFRRTFP